MECSQSFFLSKMIRTGRVSEAYVHLPSGASSFGLADGGYRGGGGGVSNGDHIKVYVPIYMYMRMYVYNFICNRCSVE